MPPPTHLTLGKRLLAHVPLVLCLLRGLSRLPQRPRAPAHPLPQVQQPILQLPALLRQCPGPFLGMLEPPARLLQHPPGLGHGPLAPLELGRLARQVPLPPQPLQPGLRCPGHRLEAAGKVLQGPAQVAQAHRGQFSVCPGRRQQQPVQGSRRRLQLAPHLLSRLPGGGGVPPTRLACSGRDGLRACHLLQQPAQHHQHLLQPLPHRQRPQGPQGVRRVLRLRQERRGALGRQVLCDCQQRLGKHRLDATGPREVLGQRPELRDDKDPVRPAEEAQLAQLSDEVLQLPGTPALLGLR